MDPNPKAALAAFQQASPWRAQWQIVNSFLPYAVSWYVMCRTLCVSYWLMLPIGVLAAGFLVRIFIIMHDCGHASFFKTRRANAVMGVIAGLCNLTPYRHWRWQHALHHGTSGDLDRRGSGDIWLLTVREYLESSRSRRIAYRLARNPVVLFLMAPLYLFVIHHRLAHSKAPDPERRSVMWTNLALLGITALMSMLMGFRAFVTIPGSRSHNNGHTVREYGCFYVQHQFEGAYWSRSQHWSYETAALRGSSFYKLPKILQWFTGNIGFHHRCHARHEAPTSPTITLNAAIRPTPCLRGSSR